MMGPMPGTRTRKGGRTGETAALGRLWGRRKEALRGRPAELGVERVVKAAVALADRDGLEAATLPAIAKALGYSAMSLYRHVGSKDELLALMQDHGAGAPPKPEAGPREWRQGLRQWARASRRAHHRRPWLARIPISGPPLGPNQVAWMEAALYVLRGTPLSWAEKLGLLLLLSGYVRQSALLAQDLERGRGSALDKADAERRYGQSLLSLADAERYPETVRMLRSGLFRAAGTRARADPADDPDFQFGLERILDGAVAAVARARKRSRPKRR